MTVVKRRVDPLGSIRGVPFKVWSIAGTSQKQPHAFQWLATCTPPPSPHKIARLVDIWVHDQLVSRSEDQPLTMVKKKEEKQRKKKKTYQVSRRVYTLFDTVKKERNFWWVLKRVTVHWDLETISINNKNKFGTPLYHMLVKFHTNFQQYNHYNNGVLNNADKILNLEHFNTKYINAGDGFHFRLW